MVESEPLEVRQAIFKETMQDGLFALDKQLGGLWLQPDSLTAGEIDKICADLDVLIKEAREIDEETSAEMLEQIRWQFYSLNTIGIVEDLTRFQDAASHALGLLNVALLSLDSSTQKNKGRILDTIKARRERDRN